MTQGYTQVSAEHLVDSSGGLVHDATIAFQPCDSTGMPLSFKTQPKGQAMCQPVKAHVVDGVFSVLLADTSTTSPLNIAYAVTVTDNQTGNALLGPGYLIQPTGATWDFDLFTPQTSSITPAQA